MAMRISSLKSFDKPVRLTLPGLSTSRTLFRNRFQTLVPSLKPTSILHRTPWQPPVAESAQKIYITLEDGTRLIDAVGGAAVTCVGNSHPKVMQAIKDQIDKVSCTWFCSLTHAILDCTIIDVYNMQLSNQPAEALAKKLVDTSGGAFMLCGFASGGLIL